MDHSPDVNGPQRKVLSCLTAVSHGSSPFIATFLLIHLSAPALANTGGSLLSSKVMVREYVLTETHPCVLSGLLCKKLLGREYYQTSFGEKYLLLTPLILHASSGIAKRLLSRPPIKSPRPLSSLLSLTGYGALVFLPIHFITHRLYPSDSSMLDFEFVKLGLHNWPWRSWLLYGGLVGCVVLHATEGINVIGKTWAWQFRMKWKSSQITRRVIAGIATVPVFTGLCFVFKEPLMAFPSLARQFEAAFTRSFIYRL
jgi:succinate dehydrogenase/fumarate reductase cytochrome b subunit